MKVNLNTATVSELIAVGFGQAAAESVIAYRTRRPYTEVPELLKTRHIGEKTYERVKDSVVVVSNDYDRGWNDAVESMCKKLTEEDMRYRQGMPFWLVAIGCDGELFGAYDIVTKVSTYSIETLRGENLSFESMGVSWEAYGSKPE